ncbi:MAG: hypothetical protein HZB50_18570 [Chloroflexi bacterium]|nr:hypothetical protein [Chloroflexota bacterium]
MNLRCIYCQTPFTLARSEMLGAIIVMNEKNQSHYDAHCPRCRRANSISRQRMELFFPNWQEAAKHQDSTIDDAPPPPAPQPVSVSNKTEPLPKEKKAPAKKAATAKAPAAKKATTAKKTTASKPAAKSSSTAKKAPAKGKKK